MKLTGRPRKNQEKHRKASIACRITHGTKDAIYAEAERQGTTVTEIMNDAFTKYLRGKGHRKTDLDRIDYTTEEQTNDTPA